MRDRLVCVVLFGVIVFLSACSRSAPAVVAAATATATQAPIPTSVPTLVPGVCRAADFPPPIRQQPNLPTGGDPGPFYGAPISDFQFPPLTYYYDFGGAAGTHHWAMCSAGDPDSILAFMRQSIAASSWMIINTPGSNAQTLIAEKPFATPTSGTATPIYCYTLNVSVGGYAGYPGEWSFLVGAPASLCQ
jgi:hypothetical protein